MSTLAHSTAATRASVEAALRGRKRDVGGTLFSGLMLSALLLVPADPASCCSCSVLQDAWPVLSTRGVGLRDERHVEDRHAAPASGRGSSAR